ncbi:E3 ubiquitin-protein ligase LRSAM1-like isoform X2 [Cimex lectularius]|uniref:RING-type domain-containing protein n=1 Tax=Cimex lectularius TaxID=79782 RepID=A0A8I6RMK2_CIMLE|nr:E3 ubiquitin-protein ligase LRSAM1-like isoform X2 [Cimex lectularius]
MSFFRKTSLKGVDYKARLEHKLYLAKEDPDPIFDLSDCDLKVVPKGVYSVCKVLRKESLLLHHNCLNSLSGGGSLEDLSLLNILDLSSNNLSTIPDNICYLTNLKELYLNNNLIKSLPDSICELKELRVLSCPFNRLKKLPQGMSAMMSLEELYLQGNPALCTLPDNLCLCPRLCQLVLDIGRFFHPPNDVVLQGTNAVLTFLGLQMGVAYKGVVEFKEEKKTSQHDNKNLAYSSSQDKLIQEGKQMECRAIERELAVQKEQEIRFHNMLKEGKDKLVEDLKAQQMKIAEEVLKFQNKKEAERSKLVTHLKQMEESSDVIIKKMLQIGKAERQPWRIIQQQEMDHAAEEILFQHNLDVDLRKKEILNDMGNLIEEEGLKIMEHEDIRAQLVKDSLSREVEWDEQLANLFANKLNDQSSIVNSIGQNETMQEAAVAKLLEKNDLESWRLTAQLKIIERQLAHLTSLELKKKKFNLEQLQCELSSKRCQLSELLVSVLAKQDERKTQLLNILRRMEERRPEESPDYWLEQYQKLLECQIRLDNSLVEEMVLLGVPQHLPALLNLELDEVSFENLKAVGITDEEEKFAVYKAIRNYITKKAVATAPEYQDEAGPSPTAPPVDYDTECVICMNSECELVFVPCGHLCCCRGCSQKLAQCPLCRSQIAQKVFVIINTV